MKKRYLNNVPNIINIEPEYIKRGATYRKKGEKYKVQEYQEMEQQ